VIFRGVRTENGKTIQSPRFNAPRNEYTGDYNESVYLRARYHAPNMGRLLSKDVWEGKENYPMFYNWWL
jgi:hypothetical protein